VDSRYKKARRMRLFERQNGLCHWCGIEMIIPQPYPSVGPWPDAMCTVEHLRDRFDPTRWDKPEYHGEERTVAACYRCNFDRSNARMIAIFPPKPKERPTAAPDFMFTAPSRLHGAFIKEDGDAA
jgi:hypothetical protein